MNTAAKTTRRLAKADSDIAAIKARIARLKAALNADLDQVEADLEIEPDTKKVSTELTPWAVQIETTFADGRVTRYFMSAGCYGSLVACQRRRKTSLHWAWMHLRHSWLDRSLAVAETVREPVPYGKRCEDTLNHNPGSASMFEAELKRRQVS